MLHLKKAIWFGLTFLSSGLLAWGDSESASDTSISSPPVTSVMSSWVELGESICNRQVRRLYVNVGTNRFGFVLPDELRAETSSEVKVTLTESQYFYFITMRITSVSSSLQAKVEELFPGGTIIEETSIDSLNRRCSVFKVQWKPVDCSYRLAMVAFVTTPAGVLELKLVSNPEKFAEGQGMLTDLLNRARSNEHGHLKMERYRAPDHN